MKQLLWLNPVPTGSTSLDPSVKPHDVDSVALSTLLEQTGYEVILHEPFRLKSRLSSWKKVIQDEDLPQIKPDAVIIGATPFLFDYVGFRYWDGVLRGTATSKKLDAITRWLDGYDGKLFILLIDPRPHYHNCFSSKFKRKRFHPILPHLDRAKFLVADPNFLSEELRPRAVKCDYWKAVDVGGLKEFTPDKDFFCVYPGEKLQSTYRKKMVTQWLGDHPDCFSIGRIDLPNIVSLSNYEKAPLKTVLDYTSRSTTSLICGEALHTWLTPRAIQSLCQGTVCSIHPDFAGKHHFPEEILRDQVISSAHDFGRLLNCKDVYNRQVEFVRSLRETAKLTGLE